MMSHPPSFDSVGEHDKINPMTLNTSILITITGTITMQIEGIWHNSQWLWDSFTLGVREFHLSVPLCFSTSKPRNNK